jgi:hypothetical protein
MLGKIKNLKKGSGSFIPDFDSSSSMLFSLGNYLFGRDEAVGIPPKMPKILGDVINIAPKNLRRSLYKTGGIQESVNLKTLKKVKDENISKWIIDAYPRKKYPAVFIGSSNGALMHICAMLGVPWIPQTVMLAVKRKINPDEIAGDIEWGKKAVKIFKKTLPHFRVHQMHDPIQDRVMVSNMAYFRMKRLKLGNHLEDYLKKALLPNGTIIISDCAFRWPSYKVSDYHYFQTGGLGDVSGSEYPEGSERIESFLKKEGSQWRRWNVPEPLEEIPEAEWGYVDDLTGDIKKLARKNGFNVKRLSFKHPESLSPLTADLSRHWYEKYGIKTRRILIECFALIQPWWAAKTASIPYWMAFNTESSFANLKLYMRGKPKYDEIYAMIMSNAVDGIGILGIDKWKKLFKKASKKAEFIGVDESKFPYDMGTFIKYYEDLKKKIKGRFYIPYHLSILEFEKFLKRKNEYNVNLKNVGTGRRRLKKKRK